MGENEKVEGNTGMPPEPGTSLFEQYNQQMSEKKKELGKGAPVSDITSQPAAPMGGFIPMPNNQPLSVGQDPSTSSDNVKQFITKESPTESGQTDAFINNESVTEETFNKSIVEDLIFLGRIEKAVNFHGNRIVLQTLTGLQELDIIDEVSHFDPPTRVAASTIGTLVRSVKTFNNQKFYAERQQEVPYSKFPNIDEAKLWILQWQGPVINQLYTKYLELKELQNEKIEEIKN